MSIKNKPTRLLLMILGGLVVITFFIARTYYQHQNDYVDPRILPARILYENYNKLANQGDLPGIFFLLDSIEVIYKNYPHYQNSFEVGVLHNNRAASLLTLALYRDSLNHFSNGLMKGLGKDSLLFLAKEQVLQSIEIYEEWISSYENKDVGEVKELIRKDFPGGSPLFKDRNIEKLIEHRATEILEGCRETRRRLSVAYTNLGIIYRHFEEYEKAAFCYKDALEFWEDNLTAENNLNILMNKPIRKRTFIEKMFPGERVK